MVGINPKNVYLNLSLSIFSNIAKFKILSTGIIKCKNRLLFINNGAIPSNSWIYTGSSGIYIWLLTPRSDNLGNGTRALFISDNGYLAEKTNNSDGVDLSFGIRPTLYLSLQVKITSGDGTEQNPYQLSL